MLAVVTSLANTGAGSLREALAGADPTITFAVSGTINTLTQLTIARSVVIDGAGQNVIVNNTAVGQRVFNKGSAGVDVTIKNLTITGGNILDTSAATMGGAIRSQGGTLTVDNCDIHDNIAREGGAIGLVGNATLNLINSRLRNNTGRQAAGAIDIPGQATANISGSTLELNTAGLNSTQGFLAIGGAIRDFGTATITDSFLRNNKSSTPLAADQLGYGGAVGVTEGGTLTIENTEISGNMSDRGGGVAARGAEVIIRNSIISGNASINNGGGLRVMRIPTDPGVVTIENTLFRDNTADGGGGLGLSSYGGSETSSSTVVIKGSTIDSNDSLFDGGGIEQFGTNLSVENSTFSGNTAVNQGGGLWSSFDDVFTGTVSVNFSTFTANTTQQTGGGIFNNQGPFSLRNSILSGNISTPNVGNDLYDYGPTSNTAIVAAFNLVKDDVGHVVIDGVMGNIVGQTANLGPLANNGGVTPTHQLLAGPGHNVADPASTLATDQRGFLRPGANAMRDMGAVESDGTSPSMSLDFNNDSHYDCADMDLLETAIDAGSPVATFDVNGDNALTAADVNAWLSEAGELRFGAGRTFRTGDANLDGVADGSDFGLWNANKFTNARRWCTGDFNQDNVTDGSDFGLWNANKFTSSDQGLRANPTTGISGHVASGVKRSVRTSAAIDSQKSAVPAYQLSKSIRSDASLALPANRDLHSSSQLGRITHPESLVASLPAARIDAYFGVTDTSGKLNADTPLTARSVSGSLATQKSKPNTRFAKVFTT